MQDSRAADGKGARRQKREDKGGSGSGGGKGRGGGKSRGGGDRGRGRERNAAGDISSLPPTITRANAQVSQKGSSCLNLSMPTTAKEAQSLPPGLPLAPAASISETKASGKKTITRTVVAPRDAWSLFQPLWWPPPADEEALASVLPDDESIANLEAQNDELTAIGAIYERELRVLGSNGRAIAPPSSIAGPSDDLEPIEPSLALEPGGIIELSIPIDTPLGDAPPVACVHVPPSLRRAIPRAVEGGSASGAQDPDDCSAAGTTAPWPVDSLPPLVLRLRLPLAYPSRAQPAYAVRCAWLEDGQLEAICAGIDAVCAEAEGSPILCQLIEWLRSDALATAITRDALQALSLPAEAAEAAEAAAAVATRAARWPRNASEVLSELVAHSQSEYSRRWNESLHNCGVCFETHASLDCVQFVRCGHTFCKGCASGYFESLMADGSHGALTCPEPSCRLVATPPEVKALLTATRFEQFERVRPRSPTHLPYRPTQACEVPSRDGLNSFPPCERPRIVDSRIRQLTLQSSLAGMSDVCWCPRCEYPAFLLDGEDGRLALCGKCSFSFCKECSAAWHVRLAPVSQPMFLRHSLSHSDFAFPILTCLVPRGRASRRAPTLRHAGGTRTRRGVPCCAKSTASASWTRFSPPSGCYSSPSLVLSATPPLRRTAGVIISRCVACLSYVAAGCHGRRVDEYEC